MNNIVVDNITLPEKQIEEQIEEKIEEKKTSYTEAGKKAQQKYREKFPEKYCELQRKLYERKKEEPEWKAKFNERSRINNKIYRDKKAQQLLESGVEPKKRGRPRKIVPESV